MRQSIVKHYRMYPYSLNLSVSVCWPKKKILGEWDVLSTLKRITSAQVKIVYNLNIKGEVINLHFYCHLSVNFFSYSVFAGLCHAPGIFNGTLILVINAALIFPENTYKQEF